MAFLISQSFLKDVNKALCPKFLFFRHVKGMETPATDAMNKGKYFEYHLLGACRGEAPQYEPLKTGGKPQVQKDLDEMVNYARKIMESMGVDIANGETQVRIETDLFVGHLDLITTDFQNTARKCIIDVKYTDTALDDRWNGWGGIESGGDNGTQAYQDAKIQALHYTKLYYDKHGVYIPFYFFIFGQSGKDALTGDKKKWVRILKFEIMPDSMGEYEDKRLEQLQQTLNYFETTNWKANPEFNTCQYCPFAAICTDRAKFPFVEKISV